MTLVNDYGGEVTEAAKQRLSSPSRFSGCHDERMRRASTRNNGTADLSAKASIHEASFVQSN